MPVLIGDALSGKSVGYAGERGHSKFAAGEVDNMGCPIYCLQDGGAALPRG